jgi:hypothetical protein
MLQYLSHFASTGFSGIEARRFSSIRQLHKGDQLIDHYIAPCLLHLLISVPHFTQQAHANGFIIMSKLNQNKVRKRRKTVDTLRGDDVRKHVPLRTPNGFGIMEKPGQ